MSIYEIMVKAFEVSTPDMYLDLLDADYVFVRHQSGEEVSKDISRAFRQLRHYVDVEERIFSFRSH